MTVITKKHQRVREVYADPNSIYNKLRRKRSAHIRAIIDKVHAQKGKVDILDLGGAEDYWMFFEPGYLEERNVTITLVNRYPQAVERSLFVAMVGDACAIDAPDNSYDIVHSNSVIEHVGDDANMARFAGEVRRLAPHYYIQTPNFWFPIEPHMRAALIHWLPIWMQARLVKAFQLDAGGPTHTLADAHQYLLHNRLLTVPKMRRLFPDARIEIERFYGANKSIMAIRD